MYPDYNMNSLYYRFNDFNYRGDYIYRNVEQPNMYNDEMRHASKYNFLIHKAK